MLGELLPALARTRKVIAADLQGHGRTGDIDRPITYEALGDDVAALMNSLGIEKADEMGYLLGAGTGLQNDYPASGSCRRARRGLNGLKKGTGSIQKFSAQWRS